MPRSSTEKGSAVIACAIALCLPPAAPVCAQEPPQQRLAECRQQIDSVDSQIVKLLNQRAALVQQVGRIKSEANLPVAAPSRERQVLDRAVQLGQGGPLPPEVLRRIYQKIVQEMRDWEAQSVSHPQ